MNCPLPKSRWSVRSLTALVSSSLMLSACGGAELGQDSFSPEEGAVETHSALAVSGPVVAREAMYASFWEPASGAQEVHTALIERAFLGTHDGQRSQGRRLKSLAVHVVDGVIQYAGVWREEAGAQELSLNRDYDGFLRDYSRLVNSGYRLEKLTTHVTNEQLRYSGIFNAGSGGHLLLLGRNYENFLAEYSKWWDQGMRLVSLSTDIVGGEVRYHGVWKTSSSPQYLRLGRTRAEFKRQTRNMARDGFELADVENYTRNNETYYNAIYDSGDGSQEWDIKHSEEEFREYVQEMTSQGYRLQTLLADRVEGLSIELMGEDLTYHFRPNTVGFSATIAHGSERHSVAAGQRRTSSDPPARAATATTRSQVASVSKTITAVGMMKALLANNVSVDDSIAPYLPSDWSIGRGVETITFRELMTHRSGFRGHPSGFDEDGDFFWNDALFFNDLKGHVEAGINMADKQSSTYRNLNYSMFRVLLPIVNGLNRSSSDMDSRTRREFMDYMQREVFDEVGVFEVSLRPEAREPTLHYPFPAGNTRGWTTGDFAGRVGPAGYRLSTNEMASFLVGLTNGKVIPIHVVNQMKNELLGFRRFDRSKHGGLYSHSGWIPNNSTGAEINAEIFSFASGVQIAYAAYSRVEGIHPRNTVIKAYDRSWVPVND